MYKIHLARHNDRPAPALIVFIDYNEINTTQSLHQNDIIYVYYSSLCIVSSSKKSS